MSGITIGIIASSREWRTLLQAHVRDHVADVRVQILREPRIALELDLDIVVIDDVSSFLTRDKVIRLREKGTRVVGIYDPEGQEGLGEKFLENLGVDLSLPSTISPEEMISAFSQLQPRQVSHEVDQAVFNYAQNTFAPQAPQTVSSLVAVSGPAGVGSTEVAIALADIVAQRKARTLLIDCDEVGPSVARRLGYHLHPNILSAIDSVANMTSHLTENVGRPSDRVANNINFEVIPGISNPEDWSQLRGSDLSDLFVSARKTWRYIIANTGPFAEDLSGYGIERFGATRTALEYADIIVGVMSPTPTGYMRFLDWLASLRGISGDREVFIVVNQAPKSSYIRGEIENQLAKDIDPRFVSGLFFIPFDERVHKAEWEGQRVSKGSFLNGVSQLASFILPANQAFVQHNVQTISTPQPQSYTPAANAGYSWDDPDVAAPTVPPAPPTAQVQPPVDSWTDVPVSVEDLEARVFDDQVPHIDELEQSIARTLNEHEVNPAPPVQPHPVVEQHVLPPDVVPHVLEPTQTGVTADGYVPAFKRGDSEPVAPQTYTPQSQNGNQSNRDVPRYVNPEQNQEQPKSGYVPTFKDDKNEDKDDENFWGS